MGRGLYDSRSFFAVEIMSGTGRQAGRMDFYPARLFDALGGDEASDSLYFGANYGVAQRTASGGPTNRSRDTTIMFHKRPGFCDALQDLSRLIILS